MTGPPEFPTPAVKAIGERLLGRVDDLAAELSAAIRRAEPSYDADHLVPVDDLRASVRNNLVHILDRLAGRPGSDLSAARATGRRRAEQGAPLPAILHSYRVAATFLWAVVLAEAAGDEAAAAALLPAAAELWSQVDELSSAVTDAYRDTVAERARRDAQTRNAVLDALLRGDLGEGSRLGEGTAALGLPRRGTFIVVAARAPRPGAEAIPRADDVLRTRDVQSVWRVELDAQVGVVVLTARLGVDRLSAHLAELTTGPVGLSEPYPSLERTPAALRQARLAQATADPAGHEIVRYERVPVAALLAGAPDAATTVARSVLGPVLALSGVECEILLGTLRTWFAEEGATSAAAARLHVHRNTVRYRLRRVEELTGRSLTRPTELAQLHLALEAARILRLG